MSGGFVETVTVTHRRVDLALHRLADGEGRPLLLLHGLGERTPDTVPGWARVWTGPVWGLDFTGHGASAIPPGGGYTSEALLGDADTALAHIGPLTVAGRGLGAYIALMLAGGRAAEVHGAVLADGPGITGGGSRPSTTILTLREPSSVTPDQHALADLAHDVRPADYATHFARLACLFSPADPPLTVTAKARPDWLTEVAAEAGVRTAPLDDALRPLLP